MVDAVLKRFGRLDILVLNAALREHPPLDEISFADWRRVLSTNLDSAFVFTKGCLPALKLAGDGRIVTFAGVTALLGLKNRVHVAASKHGIVGLTKALAQDLAEFGIRVNCVSPGRSKLRALSGGRCPIDRAIFRWAAGAHPSRSPAWCVAYAVQLAHT